MKTTLLAASLFLLCSSGCAHGVAIEKLDVDTYRITCPELSLDRCLAETANNTCDKHGYFVARGISEVNQRGRSDAPDVAFSSQAVVRCAPGQGFGDQGKELMAATANDPAKPAAAPAPAAPAPAAPAPAATPTPPPAPVCAPGSTQACVGAAACSGGQACKADGSGYEPCDCGSSVPAPQ